MLLVVKTNVYVGGVEVEHVVSMYFLHYINFFASGFLQAHCMTFQISYTAVQIF